MGETINDTGTENIESGAAGAPEGAVGAEPSADEIADLYKATGVKAPVPTGKRAGRPKASSVRGSDDDEDGAGDSNAGQAGNNDNKNQRQNASASGKNGGSGNGADAKGSKNGSDSKQVQGESEEADAGVRGSKSTGEGDSERGSEEDADGGAGGAGEDEGKQGSEAEEGKRPGKSNPEVEKRMQQLAAARKAAEDRAEAAEAKLRESTQKAEKERLQVEDPEYTVDDFRKVRDRDGNIHELDQERAELAWRRWKDGYDQRGAERQAEETRRTAREEHQSEMTRQVMKDSVEAYDSLAAMMDEYPELVSTSDKFDKEFAADAMPIIQKSIVYLEGTEPGNEEEKLPVIIGMKLDPREILDTLKRQNARKRSLPLNGTHDNVESRSNVAVPHSRSSDPTVNAANQLYKDLGIDKRI